MKDTDSQSYEMDMSSFSKDGKVTSSLETDSNFSTLCDSDGIEPFQVSIEETCQRQDAEVPGIEPQRRNKSYRKWFVLVACFLKYALGIGFSANMSVLNVEFLKEFKESKAETALVQSVALGVILITGAFSGSCVARYGTRRTGILGGILASTGMGVAYFATSVPFLLCSIGVVSGIGISMSCVSAVTSIGEYFYGKSKLLAASFTTCGSGCGGIIFPYLLDFLIQSFGWRGSLLSIGVLMLLMVPLSAIVKPISVGVHVNDVQVLQTLDVKQTETLSRIQKTSGGKRRYMQKFMKTLKSLAKNKVYVIYVIAISCALSGQNSVKIFAIDYLYVKGFDHESALLLFLCVSIACTIGMILPGFGNYIPHVHFLVIPAILSGTGVVADALLPLAITFLQHAVVLIGYGLSLGGLVSVVYTTTMKLVELENYPVGVGIVMTVLGISNVGAGFFSGLFRDITDSYDMSTYGASIGAGVATILFITAVILKRTESTEPGYDQAHCEENK